MLLQIDHHSGQPIYRQVMEQIRRQILAGHLGEGEQLASVRELAGQLNVNPMTISKAYSLLEIEGLLERRRGVGLFVAHPPGQSLQRQMLEQITRTRFAAVVGPGAKSRVDRTAFRTIRFHDAEARA